MWRLAKPLIVFTLNVIVWLIGEIGSSVIALITTIFKTTLLIIFAILCIDSDVN